MVNAPLFGEVNTGKSSNFSMDLYDSDLTAAGIDSIETLSFTLQILDGDSYITMYTGEPITLTMDDNDRLSTRTVYTDQASIQKVQQLLNALGYSCGSADGIPGKLTNSCILQFEQDHGLPSSTEITPDLIAALENAAP